MNQPPAGQTALRLIAPSALELDADICPLSMALLDVLQRRRSRRAYAADELPWYTLSRLLWAAFGVNRPLQGGRTAPSAQDGQDIDIYVAMRAGLYLFDPHRLLLHPVLGGDIRAATGSQDFVAAAPVNLVYVANLEGDAGSAAEREFYAAFDTGCISQNVYLFCAAEGLATVVRDALDRQSLARRMGLGPHQRVIAAQCVGYPAIRNTDIEEKQHD